MKFLGKRKDVESLVSTFDVGVLCTFVEGLPNSVMEYMALGKPVVATAGGGTWSSLPKAKRGSSCRSATRRRSRAQSNGSSTIAASRSGWAWRARRGCSASSLSTRMIEQTVALYRAGGLSFGRSGSSALRWSSGDRRAFSNTLPLSDCERVCCRRFLRELFQTSSVTIVVYHAPTPEVFDAHVALLKRRYSVIALSDYVAAREQGTSNRLPSKALVITLDDGHRSNHALKAVIRKHQVPVTIFLCSGIVGTRRRFWFRHPGNMSVVQRLKGVSNAERIRVLKRVDSSKRRSSTIARRSPLRRSRT